MGFGIGWGRRRPSRTGVLGTLRIKVFGSWVILGVIFIGHGSSLKVAGIQAKKT
jgi:hypothetical protein